MSFLGDALNSFDVGESTGLPPIYDLGDSVSNSSASGAYSLCTALGGTAKSCGIFGGNVGFAAHDLYTPQVQNAYKNTQSNDSTSFLGKYGNAVIGAIGLGTANPALINTSLTASGHNPNDLWMRVLAGLVGLFLIVGALYLFGSSSISDAIGKAVSTAKE